MIMLFQLQRSPKCKELFCWDSTGKIGQISEYIATSYVSHPRRWDQSRVRNPEWHLSRKVIMKQSSLDLLKVPHWALRTISYLATRLSRLGGRGKLSSAALERLRLCDSLPKHGEQGSVYHVLKSNHQKIQRIDGYEIFIYNVSLVRNSSTLTS